MSPLSQQLKGAAGGLRLVILLTGYKTSPLVSNSAFAWEAAAFP